MKANKIFGKFSAMLLALFVLAFAVTALPVTVEEVELNDVTVLENGVNRLDLERNSEVEVKVHLTTDQDVDNLELQVFLSGYEYNDVQRVVANTGVFSLEKSHLTVKKLKLQLPKDLAEDNYKLRVLLSDRDGTVLVKNFNIKVDVPRHELSVEDVNVFPSTTVKAGQALLTTVRLENNGEKDEKNVKVTVSVPELGLSTSDYVEEVETDDEEETEEMYLKLGSDVKPGTYTLRVDVQYDNKYRQTEPVLLNLVVEPATVVQASESAAQEPVQTTVTVQKTNEESAVVVDDSTAKDQPSKLKRALEVVLLVLVALLVVVGLIIGFSKLRSEDEEL
ncbi:hypothetical protein HYV79_05310 [Candidatus Woesearchaeota archaeon]|nr:hypothetical protein [Candidatus Woesearchaeota archaeon]